MVFALSGESHSKDFDFSREPVTAAAGWQWMSWPRCNARRFANIRKGEAKRD